MVIRLFAVLAVIHPLSALSHTVVKSDALIITTDNQKYDFVMRPSHASQPDWIKEKPGSPTVVAPQNAQPYLGYVDDKGYQIIDPALNNPFAETLARASQYLESGLYIHGSKIPIWTVDWHDLEVVVSGNGHHLGRIAWDYNEDLDSPAIIFYEDGKELRSWSMKALVDNNPLCLLKKGWYFGLDLKGHVGNEVLLSTRRGQTVRFNLTNGEMVERTTSQCPLEFPRIFGFRLWSTPHEDPLNRIIQNEDHQTNYWVLVLVCLGMISIIIQSRRS